MKKRILFVMTFACVSFFLPGKVSASILINEFLADPPSNISGDTNGDGVRHSSQDEFIELFNTGSATVDISGWKISDSSAVRHIFSGGSLFLANTRWVVFGGGTLGALPYTAFTSSTGMLNLNNTGDRISLTDNLNNIIDSIVYGSEAGMDQSLTRFPEGSGSFVKHLSVSKAGLAFSPGADVEGHFHPTHAEAPEPGTFFLLPLLGLISNAGGKFQRKTRFR